MYAVAPETRIMRYCALKLVHRCVLYACSKKIITLKSYCGNAERLSFTHMGRSPSTPIVTKYGLWVLVPDVINCAKFHLYRVDSFWVTGPQKWGSHRLER